MSKDGLEVVRAANEPVSKPGGGESITPEAMKAALKADCLAREQRASAKIALALKEERCIQTPMMLLIPGGVQGQIKITAVD